jgi:hypothetical protein
MGSFATTCAISGLPVERGDPVRILLVTQHPHAEADNLRCHPDSSWFPRTWWLKAKYDDYGSVDIVEEGPAKQIWLDQFQLDLVEVGIGENPYHDVPALKTQSFAELLLALWERRVEVYPCAVPDLESMTTLPPWNRGVENVLRVQQAIIREDVISALLALPWIDFVGKRRSLQTIKESAKLAWRIEIEDGQYLASGSSTEPNNATTDWFLRNAVGAACSGTGTAFRLAMRRKQEMTPRQVSSFLNRAAELVYVSGLFDQIRYQWRPTYPNGSQSGEWKTCEQFHTKLAKICRTKKISTSKLGSRA